jgi:hypothetical protein
MKYWFLFVSLIFGPALQAQTNSWDGTAISVQFNNLTEVEFSINEVERSFTRYAFEAYVQDKTFLPIEALSENKDYCRLTLNIKTELGNYSSAGVSVKFDSSYNQLFEEEMVLGEHKIFENDTPKIRTVIWGTKGATPVLQGVTCFSQDLNKNPQLEKIFPDTMNVRVLR